MPRQTEINLRDVPAAMTELDFERYRRGQSVVSLAAESGIATGSSFAWRSGGRVPSVLKFIQYAETLGFEVIMRRKTGKAIRTAK